MTVNQMSKITVVFDPHCWPHKRFGGELVKGINRRGALCLDVLRRAIDVANANDAPLVVAGDLIDSAGPVQPQFAAALRDELARCQNGAHLLLGNHDMTADGDHSLDVYVQSNASRHAPRRRSACDWSFISVIDDIMFTSGRGSSNVALSDEDICMVPFHRDIRDERVRDVPLLIAHFGVYDDSFSPWCKRSKGAWHVDALFAFLKERNIKCCLLGDWHSRALWETDSRFDMQVKHTPQSTPQANTTDSFIIMQGGALVSTGWDNPGLRGYGTVALWDIEEYCLSWQELPGPRFCVARSDAEEADIIDEAAKLGHNLYLRRYYSGDRPATPQGIEAYEALPVAIETAATRAATWAKYDEPKLELERLVSEWLEQFGNDKDALEAHVRRYL